MKLTTLGNNGPFPAAGGACSGYLLEEGDIRILLDCGNGVLSNLQKICAFDRISAIILTHLHSDHISDMLVLRYAVQLKLASKKFPGPIKVFLPPEPADIFKSLDIKGTFDVTPITPDLKLSMGPLRISFMQMKHSVLCYGVSVEKGDDKFVYSGDTSWCDNILDFGRGARVLLLDAGLLNENKTSPNVPHLTAGEAGEVAVQTGADRLIITHFNPDFSVKEYLKQARSVFRNTHAAKILETVDLF